jgi:sterol desaturase/sphingolipid hydroxylase (fatty acid hydroxylase superfamily)
MESILSGWLGYAYSVIGFGIVFSILAHTMPCNKNQPLIRSGIVADLLYGLIIPLISKFVFIAFLTIGFGLFFFNATPEELAHYMTHGHGYLATLPIWLQAAMVFVISDVILYWTHRWFHQPNLWKWHAIHHSSKHIDFLSSQRFHPINVWGTFTLVNASMIVVGFSPESIAIMGFFNTAYSYMVHANLNWTFGPFKYVFASPVFHRWHHTTQREGLDKNFAPTFPLLDIMFGTFYMPEGKLPDDYGIDGADVPETFIGQLLWPFKQ